MGHSLPLTCGMLPMLKPMAMSECFWEYHPWSILIKMQISIAVKCCNLFKYPTWFARLENDKVWKHHKVLQVMCKDKKGLNVCMIRQDQKNEHQNLNLYRTPDINGSFAWNCHLGKNPGTITQSAHINRAEHNSYLDKKSNEGEVERRQKLLVSVRLPTSGNHYESGDIVNLLNFIP